MSRPAGLGGDLRAAGVIQLISAHAAWTALPESGDVMLSDALVITAALAQFVATLHGSGRRGRPLNLRGFQRVQMNAPRRGLAFSRAR